LEGKNVGLPLLDEGDGDVNLLLTPLELSDTRTTWNRLRLGLGKGELTGDGIGLGERILPLAAFFIGSNSCFGTTLTLEHVSEIFLVLKLFLFIR
jgi:hypothetical protein